MNFCAMRHNILVSNNFSYLKLAILMIESDSVYRFKQQFGLDMQDVYFSCIFVSVQITSRYVLLDPKRLFDFRDFSPSVL